MSGRIKLIKDAGAYLHALMKDFITMRFVGWAVDLLCEVNPEYGKNKGHLYLVQQGNIRLCSQWSFIFRINY
jgi:hypothetical protein